MYILLIQGPIISNGLNYNSDFVEFNSFDYVYSNIEGFSNFFLNGKVILSTYEDEIPSNKRAILNKFSNLKIIESKKQNLSTISYDSSISLLRGLIGRRDQFKTSKKFQYYSTLNGINEISNDLDSNISVIKIRTDILIDFELLANELNLIESKNIDSKISMTLEYIVKHRYFSFLTIPFVADAIIISDINLMKSMFVLADKISFSFNVHNDLAAALTYIFGKGYYNYKLLEKRMGDYSGFCFLLFKILYLTKRLLHSVDFDKLIQESSINILSSDFSNSMKWRGSEPKVRNSNIRNSRS